MNNKKKKFSDYMLRATGLLLLAAMLLSASACSSGIRVRKERLPQSGLEEQISTSDSTALHSVAQAQELETLASSGLVELLFDRASMSVCVRDTSHDKLWTALPSQENFEASVAQAEIVSADRRYTLNTQDHSVAFSSASARATDSGVTVSYILTPDAQTAQKTEYSQEDIAFSLTIEYELRDGSMYVSASTENLVKGSPAKLTQLELLNYFGAAAQAAQGDFIFVPDGSGAIIKTDVEDDAFSAPLEFAVYGDDHSTVSQPSGKSAALVAAYGMKQGQNAFVVLITRGDALATISADRARAGNTFFRAGSSFCITPASLEERRGGQRIYLADESYDGEIEMCVRFLNGSNAGYTGMAAASREQMIRERVLSTRTVSQAEYLPLDMSVIGAAQDELFSLWRFSLSRLKTFTDFEQAQDMVARMKAKGINGINLRYKGVLSGGYNQSDVSSASLLNRLGSRADLEELSEYMNAQNMGLYLDVDLISSSKRGSFSSGRSARNIFGDYSEYSYNSIISDFIGRSSFEKRLLGIDSVERSVVKLLSNTRYGVFTGFCISDAGNILYSDFASGYNRQESAQVLSEQLAALTAGRSLMTDNGNFYMIKDVQYVSHIPTGAFAHSGEAYESVPFVELVLHGIVEYSCEPINLSGDEKTAMLRCVEYGACPAYEWSYTDGGDGVYYDNWINSAADFYARANDALADVRSSRMTSHSEIRQGVFSTEYDTGAIIYVNYTAEDVVVSGMTVPAGDFLRIN